MKTSARSRDLNRTLIIYYLSELVSVFVHGKTLTKHAFRKAFNVSLHMSFVTFVVSRLGVAFFYCSVLRSSIVDV